MQVLHKIIHDNRVVIDKNNINNVNSRKSDGGSSASDNERRIRM